jgi:hypothetical protein
VTGEEREREREHQDTPFKCTSPVTHFLWFDPTFPQFYHLPDVSSNFESVDGVNHWLGQSPHGLVISGNALTDTLSGVLYSTMRFSILTSGPSRLTITGSSQSWCAALQMLNALPKEFPAEFQSCALVTSCAVIGALGVL